MFEGAGFEVIDLGGPGSRREKFVDAIKGAPARHIVGFFRPFLTTTMPMFQGQHQRAAESPALRGPRSSSWSAAPRSTQEYADVVGADGYAADASAAVVRAKELIAAAPRPPPMSSQQSRLNKQPKRPEGNQARAHHPVLGDQDGADSETTSRSPIIGERINPTGRKIFQQQLRAGDPVPGWRSTSRSRWPAGAMLLDVNMGRAAGPTRPS